MGIQRAEPPTVDDSRHAGATDASTTHARWLTIFQERHGHGSYDRLLALLGQPCVTFAEIAATFGVTRERVRQWHMRLMPHGPTGHERQRLCGAYHRKRRLLEDTLFRSFYQHARPHFERGRIELIKSSEGYRTRSVRIDQSVVAIRDASLSRSPRRRSAAVYTLSRYGGSADFVYYRLTKDDYLFVPTDDLPRSGTTFSDLPTSRYRAFKNTFKALQADRHIAADARAITRDQP